MSAASAPGAGPGAARPSWAGVVGAAYPLHDLDGPVGRRLVRHGRDQLADTGVCVLPGFLTAAAVADMIDLAGRLAPQGWTSDQTHTVYFDPPEAQRGERHPRARQVRSAKVGIAYDLLPPDAPIRRVYDSDELTRFVAALLGKPGLHRSADPLDAAQVTVFEPGQELGWHFDRSEFSVTVMYQPADTGGHFEYVPALRDDRDERFAAVADVLDGDRRQVVTLAAEPGTFAVFRGHHALHRVTPVGPGRARINSVLTYGDRPDMRLNELTSRLFYGRVG